MPTFDNSQYHFESSIRLNIIKRMRWNNDPLARLQQMGLLIDNYFCLAFYDLREGVKR